MRRAFTLLELLCAIAIIALVAALLLPVVSRSYAQVHRASCANNLKNIGTAFHAWAHEHNDLFPMQVSTNFGGTHEFAEATVLNPEVSLTFRHFQALSNELLEPKLLRCPADGFRTPAKDFASLHGSNVSYWINLAARLGDANSPVAGDRNVRTSGRLAWTFLQFSGDDVLEFTGELHGSRGNVLFGDAHVDALAGNELRSRFVSSNSGIVTLSLPREDFTPVSDSSASQSEPQNSLPTGPGMIDSPNSPAANTNLSQPAAKSNANVARAPGPGRIASQPTYGDPVPIIITKLDGTVVTSTAPRAMTSPALVLSRPEPIEPPNPLLEFIGWLGQTATKHTYALLFLLLLALIGFEIARRRAERRRRARLD